MEWTLGIGFGLVIYVLVEGMNRICQRLDAIRKHLDRIEKHADALEDVRRVALRFLV
jgi:hypothetical protein